jgi:hypothetical protein
VTTLLKVSATPTVLYFWQGEELERIHGFRSSLFHKQTIQDHFGSRTDRSGAAVSALPGQVRDVLARGAIIAS